MEKVLSTMETANILKCSVENVRALERKGALAAIRIGGGRIRLFNREEVEKLARERATRLDGNDHQGR